MKNVEDIYTLSSMQQGMLFHALYAPKQGVYFEQISCTLHRINFLGFKQAWQQVVARHAVLRTSFIWDGLDEPLQVVHKQVNLPWVESDWQHLSLTQQQKQLEAFLEADRQKGLELNQAPLMRFALMQIEPTSYYFIWSHHHLLLDGWSSSIIFKEVFAFYESITEGKDLYLETPRPYRDYIAYLQQQDLSQAKVFWQQALKHFTMPTPLMVDKHEGKRSHQQTYKEQYLCFRATTTTALKSFAIQHHLTLNTLVQGAWALLLSRYCGQQDVVFGATVSGRLPTLVGAESMVGLFINTLPVRVQISAEDRLLPWLHQLQVQQVEWQQYSYTPLVEIHRWSDIQRGMPLFESIVVFENYPVDTSLQQRNTSIEISNIRGFERTNYPLTVIVAPGSELSVRFSYDADRFDSDMISRMLGHFQTLLTGIVANPQASIWELPLLSAAEQRQLIFEWNDTKGEETSLCIHQLFETQVEKTPDSVAVSFFESQLTYQQLNDRSNQLAHHLHNLGVGPDVIVGICMERSQEMLVGLLGILKAGGAYLPLDPNYPEQRLALMLADAQVPVLITDSQLVASLPASDSHLVCCDRDWDVISLQPSISLNTAVNSENLAYVIYTSGSTGQPKGVMNTHKGIVNHLLWMQQTYHLTADDRVLQKTPFSFDVSVWELFWPLLSGAGLVIAKPGGHQDSAYLLELIVREKITTIHFVPSMLQVFLEQQQLETCSWLRQVFCSGEALSVELQQRFFERCSGKLHNLYGPTEAAIDVTFWECQRHKQMHTVPIGRPTANTQVYILDSHLQPVPIGIPGELHIGGIGLARGYLNATELTKEKFIPHPFSNRADERLYKTGDRVRYLADGNIEFLGRIDNQVKVRGFRIELGEIEAVLAQHPLLLQAAVVLNQDQLGHQRLVAYVISQSDSLNTQELSSFLKERLPAYMLPSAFVLLSSMPLTANGKLDRRALSSLNVQPSLTLHFIPPQTPTEKILATIWSQVLGLEVVGIYDNFFELGGDSIKAIQVVSRLAQQNLQLKEKHLFQYPTIAELAQEVVFTNQKAEQKLISGIVPLTPIQSWFFLTYAGEKHHFNQSLMLATLGRQNVDALHQVVRQIQIHHDALRLRFKYVNDRVVQECGDADHPFSFEIVDLVGRVNAIAQLEAEANQVQASMDLEHGPLIRFVLFHLDQGDRLLMVAHHLVIDGLSWRILLEDISTGYKQACVGSKIKFPSKTDSYQRWSTELQKYSTSHQFQEEQKYWQQLANTVVDELIIDFPEAENLVCDNCTLTFCLTPEQTDSLLKQVHGSYNTEINDILLASLAQAMNAWCGGQRFLIDLEGHGRISDIDTVDVSRTVGWFTTIYPVLIELVSNTVTEYQIKFIKEMLRRIPLQGIGYGILRYLTQPQSDLIHIQPSILFNYLGRIDEDISLSMFDLAEESCGDLINSQSKRTHELEFSGIVHARQLRFSVTFSARRFKQQTIQKLLDCYQEALQGIIEHCQQHTTPVITPSDLTYNNLSLEEFDEIFADE